MKKTLIALAAVAASSAAFAQSSVTLYGSLDLSVESVKGEKSVTRVTSGNHTTSRFGVKGVEDLGGGLKAKFNLEAPINADTGEVKGNFWNRQAWLGLQGGFGELRLGRQDTPIGAIAGNTSLLGGQAYDDFKIAGTLAGNDARRTDNAITYILPKLADGLTASLQYSTKLSGAEAANDDEGKHYGLSVQYAANGFGAGLGQQVVGQRRQLLRAGGRQVQQRTRGLGGRGTLEPGQRLRLVEHGTAHHATVHDHDHDLFLAILYHHHAALWQAVGDWNIT